MARQFVTETQYAHVHKELIARIDAAKTTYRHLSDRWAISTNTLADLAEKRLPHLTTMLARRLAQAFDMSLEELCGPAEPDNPFLTMNPAEFLHHLRSRVGVVVSLEADGTHLRCQARKETITPMMWKAVAHHNAMLLWLLQQEAQNAQEREAAKAQQQNAFQGDSIGAQTLRTVHKLYQEHQGLRREVEQLKLAVYEATALMRELKQAWDEPSPKAPGGQGKGAIPIDVPRLLIQQGQR